MGRQQNPLIARCFNRGAKLPDHSNRYEQTCKACGEHFAKGRFETLCNHVFKKCRCISTATRQQLLLEAHGLDRPAPSVSPQGGDFLQHKPAGRNNYNGLNVLAEASRQVGTSHGSLARSYVPLDVGEGHGLQIDPTLDVDAFASSILNISDDRVEAKESSPTALDASLESMATSAKNVMRTDSGPDLPDIAMIDDLEHGKRITMIQEKIADSFPPADPIPWQPSAESMNAPSSESLRPLIKDPGAESESAPGHFIPESGTPANATPKPKVRAKFSPVRREQVKKMRQMGACLRCQRLRKPCDSGTPCRNCASIENPRKWKDSCIRKKLGDAVAEIPG